MSNKNNYISTETKKNKNFQNVLANMARADAQHDIHILKNEFKNPSILNSFSKGLPAFPNESFDEEDCMTQIFMNTATSATNKKLDDILFNVPDVTFSKKPATSFDIGFQTQTLHRYTCVKFVIPCSTNNLKNLKPAPPEDMANQFCTNTDLGGISNEAIFVVDFNQHGFLSIFKQGKASSLYKIHYIMSPEVVNDPAGKTSIYDSIFTSPNTGIVMNSYVQTSAQNILYTKYDIDGITAGSNNQFFSNYNFQLSPVQKIYTSQKAEKFITNLKINWTNEKGQPYTCDINDSKGENSNATVLGYIKKIIRQIQPSTTSNNDMVNFNFSTKCQQKRGGDWFQVLSCLDLYNREFTNIQNVAAGSKRFPSTIPVYFVSHDRIAVSYALLMGVNAIYLDYYGQAYIFKNQEDIATKTNGKTYEETLFDMLRSKSFGTGTGTSEISKYLSFNINYIVAREDFLSKSMQGLMNTFANVTKTIQSIPSGDMKSYQKTVKEVFQMLFPEIVKYHFMKTNLLDTREDVSVFQQNMSLLTSATAGQYNENMKSRILDLYKAYNRIYSVYTQHQGGTKDLIESSIILWSSNVNKLDVYRSAKNVLNQESLQDKETFNMRLLNYNTNPMTNEKRQNDIYIFLPYIQTVEDAIKTKLLEFINCPLFTKTMEYRNQLQMGKSIFRLNRLSPNEVFFNQVANCIYETRVFIHFPFKAPTPPENLELDFDVWEPLDYWSSDDILVSEDLTEIEMLKGEGKSSNRTDQVTQDEPVNPKPLVGGFTYYERNVPGRSLKNDVVCDVSLRQITWPLLTNLLLTFDVNHVKRELIQSLLFEGTTPTLSSSSSSASSKTAKRKITDDQENTFKRGRMIGGINHEYVLTNVLTSLYQRKNMPNKNVLRGPPSQQINIGVIGYHPLLPIYMILTSMWYFVEPTLASNSFYYSYINYVNMLEKMMNVLMQNYLNDSANSVNVLSGYFIGFALKPFLFTMYETNRDFQQMIQSLNIPVEQYRLFTLKNDMFSNNIAGHIIETDVQKETNLILTQSELFKNYIINEVRLPVLLNESIDLYHLPDTLTFQERIYQLMKTISNKIQKDRKPILISPPPSSSSSTSSQKKIIDSQGNIVNVPIEPKKTGVYTLQDFSRSTSTSSSSPVYVTSSTSSKQSSNQNRSRGGGIKKKTKKRKHNKKSKREKRERITRKNRK